MEQKIEAHKITKPIQLLGAWLIGLVVVNGSFLGSASVITTPSWVPAILVIASIVNVPLFLAAIFLLQTKFRPEMQEDTFYSKYLEGKTKTVRISESPEKELIRSQIENKKNFQRINQFINDVEEKLSEMSSTIDSISIDNHPDDSLSEKIKALEESIKSSENALEVEKGVVKWAGIRVQINNKLPSFRSVTEALNKAGIPIDINGEFGANVPEKFQISFGKDVDIENLQKLLSALSNERVDFLEYASNDMHRRRIYIGSYAFEDERLGVALDERLIDKIHSKTTAIEEVQQLAFSGDES